MSGCPCRVGSARYHRRMDSQASQATRPEIAALLAWYVEMGVDVALDEAPTDRFAPPPPAERPFALHTFGAQFCEVRVDADLGILRVERLLGMFSCGRVLNPDTARSQLLGGMIGGLGMALLEETHVDSRGGRIVNASLADYLVPVHADMGSIEATWIDEFDVHASPIGAKGLGELPIIGVAAAVANAVSNATGVRVRELPITIEKVLHAGHIDSSRGLHLK